MGKVVVKNVDRGDVGMPAASAADSAGTDVAPTTAREPLRQRRRLPPSIAGDAKRPVLGPLNCNGELIYAPDVCTATAAVQRLVLQRPVVLGFDIEWRVTFVRGQAPRAVATLQLATVDCTAVIHLSQIGHLPDEVIELLAAEGGPALVGVGVSNDLHKLAQDYPELGARGVSGGSARALDLNTLLHRRLGRVPQRHSLATLAREFLGRDLIKDQSLRCSNWEQAPLSRAQLNYAALDAQVGYSPSMLPLLIPPPNPAQTPTGWRPLFVVVAAAAAVAATAAAAAAAAACCSLLVARCSLLVARCSCSCSLLVLVLVARCSLLVACCLLLVACCLLLVACCLMVFLSRMRQHPLANLATD